MNVLVLYGSPHKKGTTKKLAEKFLQNMKNTKHDIKEIYLSDQQIHACMGCGYCRKHQEKCIQKDAMEKIYPLLLEADMIVLVSPLYYFGLTAQLKVCVDRFIAINNSLRQQQKQLVLLTAGNSTEDWIMDGILSTYHVFAEYMHWESAGEVCAIGCGTAESLEGKEYLKQAEELGEKLADKE